MNLIPSHPYAELFPAMTDQEFKELVDDIKRQGLLSPIWLYEERILDGRHRYRACLVAGAKHRFEEYKGGDPLAFVVSRNLKRRNLNPGQLAMIAAKIANMPSHRVTNKSANVLTSQSEAAKSLGISTRSVTTAVKLANESPALAAKVKSGEISLNAAGKKLSESSPKTTKPDIEIDQIGYPIPKPLLEVWQRRQEYQDMMTMASRLCSLFKAIDPNDRLWAGFHAQEHIIVLNKIHASLSLNRPHAVCTLCQGHPDTQPKSQCTICKGRGFIGSAQWDRVDDRTKAMRRKMCKMETAK